MKKYKVYACCLIDSAFSIVAGSAAEAEQIADNAKFGIVAKADTTYLPNNFAECKAVFVPEGDFVRFSSLCDDDVRTSLPDGKHIYDVFCSFYVDYEAVIEATKEDDIDDLFFENCRYLFDCEYLGTHKKEYQFEAAYCEDYNLHEVREINPKISTI